MENLFWRRKKRNEELGEEIQSHLTLSEREKLGDGRAPSDAHNSASREFGNVPLTEQLTRDTWGSRWFADLAQDLRFAFRTLRKTPGFAAVAILTLAVGIGVNTIAFTFYESIVWKPLPVRSPEQIDRIYGQKYGSTITEFSYGEYLQLRDSSESFSSMIATSLPEQVLYVPAEAQRGSDAEAAEVRLVSGNYFTALGVNLSFGRSFEERESAVVLSYSFWQRRLQMDRSALGKTIAIQGVPVVIVGIAPEDFAGTGLPPGAPDFWLPLSMQRLVFPSVDWLHDADARQWQILGRRKPDVSLGRATAELDTLGARWPVSDGRRINLSAKVANFFFPPDSDDLKIFATAGSLVMIPVLLILVIGCINLINLLVARNGARDREIAVRLALGAGRLRLIRQLCTETAVLGLFGGAVALILSVWASRLIQLRILEIVRRVSGSAWAVSLNVAPDWRIFAFTAVLSVLSGIAIGLWPASRSTRTDINTNLKLEGATPAKRWEGRSGVRDILIGVQMAASLMLLAGAGLLFRGAWRSHRIETGFETQHVFRLGVATHSIAATQSARIALFREIAHRLEAMPEVVSVAVADRPPFLGSGSDSFRSDEQLSTQCQFNYVSERYFETLGIPVLAGRTFALQEAERRGPVAVVSESAARALWPGKDPLGRHIYGPFPGNDSFTVIGIVKTVRSTYLSKVDSPAVYFPRTFSPGYFLLVRTRIAPDSAMRRATATLSAIDPNLPSQSYMGTLEDGPVQIQQLMAEAPAIASTILGLLALLLASIGTYGTASYLVVQRTREIGVHIALGAQKSDVIRLVMGRGLRAVVIGAAVGLVGAFALSTVLSALLVMPDMPDLTYGAGPFSVATYFCVLIALASAVLVASFVPARRAMSVDPIVALRYE
jgi:predicted permease